MVEIVEPSRACHQAFIIMRNQQASTFKIGIDPGSLAETSVNIYSIARQAFRTIFVLFEVRVCAGSVIKCDAV